MIARLLVVALVALGALAGCGDDEGATVAGSDTTGTQRPAAEAPGAAVRETTPEAIAPAVADGRVLLVDVRTDEEWDAGHAPDALHIPLDEVEQRLDEIAEQARNRPVAFVCATGRRSAQAAAIAADSGRFDDVRNVAGGMTAWAGADLPLEPADGRIV